MGTLSGTGSSGITFSGLFSGLDTNSIISQLMNIERQPITQLQDKKVMLGFQKDALNTVNSSMLSLQNSLKDFTNGVLLSNQASSSDENSVTASADASADAGVYTVSLLTMAQAHRVGTDAQAGNYVGGAGDQFRISIGANNFDITVNNGDSMETVLNRIYTSMDGGTSFTDVATAQLITDPLTGNKTVVLQSATEGTANSISMTELVGTPAQNLGFITGAGAIKNTLQAAQNLSVTINGVAVTNSTNTITDAVTGVTFTIKGFGGADITVGPNDDDMVSKVKAFVDQFNTTTDLLAGYITEDKVASPKTADDLMKGVLQNDTDLGQAKSDIRMKTTGYIDNTLTKYNMLSMIGIESEPLVGSTISDNITFDESKLRSALSDDKDEVVALLEGFADQLTTYLDSQTKVSAAQSLAGSFYQRILSIDEQTRNIDSDISTWEDRVSVIEQRYRDQFSAMETLLQQMQSQSSYLSTQLGNLTKSSSSK